MKTYLINITIIAQITLLFSMPSFAKQAVEINLSTNGDDISFDKKEVNVKYGDEIFITFKNKASKDSHIIHNIAIVTVGGLTNLMKTLQKSNYEINSIKSNKDLIALSKDLPPGEQDTIRINPKKPGKYIYVCLMAGHGDLFDMTGYLIVKK